MIGSNTLHPSRPLVSGGMKRGSDGRESEVKMYGSTGSEVIFGGVCLLLKEKHGKHEEGRDV